MCELELIFLNLSRNSITLITFSLYDKETFDESLTIFQQNIEKNFKNLEKITWNDENILLEIEK